MKPTPVVCAVIVRMNLVFIARKKKGKSNGGFWEFPGGKIEPGELEKEALERELKEELGMTIRVKQRLETVKHLYTEKALSIELIPYICDFISMEPGIQTDHDKYEWVELSKLDDYKIAKADTLIIEQLKLLFQ